MILRIGLLLLLAMAIDSVDAKPKTSLTEAICLAKEFVREQGIQNSHRHLVSVVWNEDLENPKDSAWAVYWAPNQDGLLDAQLVVWVYDDGRVRYQDEWA